MGTPWVGTVIDVSEWQSKLPDLAGVMGVIARAGIGTKPDAMFLSHIAQAKRAGLWVGSYWYNWGALSVSDQVNAYIAREKQVGGVALHTIDWEGAEGFTAAETADFIRIYKTRTGEPICLYASEGRYRDLGQDADWVANYSREPARAYDMWQYGSFRGVDGNHARQRIIDLVKGSSQVAPRLITNETPKLVTVPAQTLYALDGVTALAVIGVPLTARPSPFEANPFRAIYVTVGGVRQLALVKPGTVSDAIDPTQYGASDIAAARAAQLLIDQLAISSAQSERDVAVSALSTAQATERERIALALAGDEAARVRSA